MDQYVDSQKFCDGSADCSDGSDGSDGSDEELDCKLGVTCNVGGVQTDLKLYSVCNGISECDDGSDEPTTCAPRMCSTM